MSGLLQRLKHLTDNQSTIGSIPISPAKTFRLMNEFKLNLTMILPGRVMMSERECMRKTRKPLMGKGKKADKQVIDKEGKPVWVTVKEPDPLKCDKDVLHIMKNDGTEDILVVFTRKERPASKSVNLTNEAYEYFISSELPEGFHAPKNFKPKVSPFRKPVNLQCWLSMSETERLEWHLNNICASMGGTMASYTIHGE